MPAIGVSGVFVVASILFGVALMLVLAVWGFRHWRGDRLNKGPVR